MYKKLKLVILLLCLTVAYSDIAYTANNEPVYTQFRAVDAGTFNEYRYKITDEFFNLRNKYELNGDVNTASAGKILELAKKGYNYLPDSLSNKNYYNYLKTSIERGIKYPNNVSNYTAIVSAIENYLDKTNIQTVLGKVEAFPSEGNAPMIVTLRGNIVDPAGTKIPAYNYTWWMHENGRKIILGNGNSLTHLFKEEGNFSVFLDVSSGHKNKAGYTDVLPFSKKVDIKVKEKVASVIIKINSLTLNNTNEVKFTPDEAVYGLLFDATSSTATSGSKFINTKWDFGNGVVREYRGDPRVERVKYTREGEYTAKLTLQTNELKTIEREFVIAIHNPIATIKSSIDNGYMGEKFTFSAQNTVNNKDLSYSWEIVDLNKDEIIFRKAGSLFTHTFNEKGKYNLKMRVAQPSGETDIDTKIIYINSRPPTADFSSSIPFKNKPNRILFDATKSFDPDFSDDGKLKYNWIINGERVLLEEPNYNGSTGYYTFDSVGEHSVILDVIDPDNISSQKKAKVKVSSILSVDLFVFPRVAQRLNTIRFVSDSPEARFYEWDFGDGTSKGGKNENITHKFLKSGVYNVTLKVIDENDNSNTTSKNVYIGNSNSPYSFISLKDSKKTDIAYDNNACEGEGAYVLNRVDTVTFSGNESIDITGKNTGLTYSWKLGRESYKNSAEFTKKFDELGCFPIKLTVKSDENGKTHSTTKNVVVRNLKPILSSIDLRVVDNTTDPVIVNVSALGAKDLDGVVQSYLWYYYTDIDSEPQDFRATKGPSTSFVLPKVTGNYYFVVVMKDNNEDRITSEEITGSKYFMTLTGDNLNTPLVKLSVNDSSVGIGEEVVFTSNVENILGQDLSKKVKYSWDFDGDGFYDKESTTNTVTYKYKTSGEKHAKVKAKYKGFSNTKNVTINVSNVLKPNYDYISIGNKFVFFDTSLGTTDSLEWSMGDGTIIKNNDNFTHTYKDNKVAHIVTLKITEGTKVKKISKKIIKNVKNRILARKQGLVLFSNETINSKNEIILEEKKDLFIYLGESKPDIENYVIDYDINYDSDLNGSNDDDENNSKFNSYTSGNPIKVKLNKNKFQTIRAFIKNKDGEVVGSKDITIQKQYIEEKAIDASTIIFDGVTDSVKIKIEKLKELVSNLPKEHKLKGLMYVQKLQEEWGDNRGKTAVILEFEGFIDETGVSNSNEIIELLEGLLVENQEDKSEKSVMFTALKNLIPTTIVCKNTGTGSTTEKACYDELVSKLETIKDNNNLEENKILGSEILKHIGNDNVMTNKSKIDFKAILKSFVYGGVDNIPEEEVKEVIEEEKSSSTGKFMSLLFSILKWLFIIILCFIGIVGLYYLYFKVVNRDDNIGFQDFIIEKTSGVKKTKPVQNTSFEDDILKDLDQDIVDDKKEENNKINNETKQDNNEKVVSDIPVIKEEKIEKKQNFDEFDETLISSNKDVNTEKQDSPDWLKGSFDDSKSKKVENKSEEIKTEEIVTKKETVKNEIKTSNENKQKNNFNKGKRKEFKKPTLIKKSDRKIETKEEIISDKQIEEVTKIENEDVPDWLKSSFDSKPKKVVKDTSVDNKIVDNKSNNTKKIDTNNTKTIEDNLQNNTTEENKSKIDLNKKDEKVLDPKIEKKVDSNESDDMPDWLKGSFEDAPKTQKKVINTDKKIENTKQENTKQEPKIEKSIKTKPVENNKNEVSKSEKPKKIITENIDKSIPKKIVEKKQPTKKTEQVKEQIKEQIPKKVEPIKKTKEPIKKDISENKQNQKTESNNKKSELWDDGMKVPDWLKTDDDK